MGLLEGKVAVITGASKGIGRAIALAFSKEGANVVITARSIKELKATANKIGDEFGTNPLAVKTDITDADEVRGLFKKAVQKYGRIDILVNNAGYPLVEGVWNKPFYETMDEDFRMVGEVDLIGAIRCSREAIRVMMRQRRGVIINISSTPALAGHDKGAAYTVAKAGILGLTKQLAYSYGRYNIRVNALALGNIKTPGTYASLDKGERRRLAEEAPLGRWGEPEEVARVCVTLASDYTSFVTGQTIVVDGGTVMR